MQATTASEAARLLSLINGNWTTQALGVAAELGIADRLHEAPASAADLARATGCDAASVRRLLRALSSIGICSEGADGRYRLEPAGGLLRDGDEPSLRAWAIWSARCQWDIWGHLLESVRTGRSARNLLTSREGYAHLESEPEAAGIFHRAMVDMTRFVADSVRDSYDFAGCKRVIDVGGGHGELMLTILAGNATLRGAIVDLPHARAGAVAAIETSGLQSRCEFIAADFFERLPPADVYLLKSILHNWDDARAVEILRRCTGKVLVVERLMPDRPTASVVDQIVVRGDLNMMVGLGGRERTSAEFTQLAHAAGLRTTREQAIAFGYSLIELDRAA